MDTKLLCMGCMEPKGAALICPHCGWKEGNSEDYSQQYLPIGTVLNNKFLVGKVLGYGGFGITYIGWDKDLDVKVAIKEYMPQGLVGRTQNQATVSIYTSNKKQQFEYGLDKFLEEAKTVAQFSDNPNIVSVKHFFKENDTAYFVMNYVEGITLKQYINFEKDMKIEFSTVRDITAGVIEALRIIHNKGLMHRDISPDNIYISKEGIVKVLDFGAARYALGENSSNLSVILKPGYAPFEQYTSKGKQGSWTDIYALAATIYNALTGEIPPNSTDRVVDESLRKPSEMGINIPEASEESLLKALSIRAADRYQSVEEFKADFLGADFKPSPILDASKIYYEALKNKSAKLGEKTTSEEECLKPSLVNAQYTDKEAEGNGNRTLLLQTELPGEQKIQNINKVNDTNPRDNTVLIQEYPPTEKYENHAAEEKDSLAEEKNQKVLIEDPRTLQIEEKKLSKATSKKDNKLFNKSMNMKIAAGFVIVTLIGSGYIVSNSINAKSIKSAVASENSQTETTQGTATAAETGAAGAGTTPGSETTTGNGATGPAAVTGSGAPGTTGGTGTTTETGKTPTPGTTPTPTPAPAPTTPIKNYDSVKNYIAANQYDKAVLEASSIMSAGDKSSEITSLMDTAAKNLGTTAYNQYQSSNKIQALKYYLLLAKTYGVPQAHADDGKRNVYSIGEELGNLYTTKNIPYNATYFYDAAIWAGNSKLQANLNSAANSLLLQIENEISTGDTTAAKNHLDLIVNMYKWVPENYIPSDIISKAKDLL
ncbi:MAG: serine/threonine protein kinase [Clostridiaceae bacterium]